jgi:hypothetical protein
MSKKPTNKARKNTDTKKQAAKTTKAVAAEVSEAVTKVADKANKAKDEIRATRPAVKVTRAANAGGVEAQIASLRKLSVVVYVALAAAAWFMMSGATQQFRWPFLTRDALASQEHTVFALGSKLVVEMPYRVAVIIVLALAALWGLLLLTKLKAKYARAVADKVVGYRWVGIAVVAALMMEVVAMLNGVQDILVLKLVAGSVAVTALLSWLAERDNKVAGKPVWTAFTLSVFSGLFPWLLIGGILAGTAMYGGGVRLPWYVYALDGAVFLGFSGTALTLFKSIRGRADYLVTERNYTVISLLMKTAFAVILIWGLMR